MTPIAFEWPTPPYFQINLSKKNEPETCLIYLRDGTKILGDLIRFMPEESSILFLSTRSETNEVIHLNYVKSMRLVKSLPLNKQNTSLESRTDEVYPAI